MTRATTYAELPAPSLVPIPARFQMADGQFPLASAAAIHYEQPSGRDIAEYLADQVRWQTGLKLDVRLGPAPENARVIELLGGPSDPSICDEGYELDVTPTRVAVRAADPRGWMYAVQTIRQLLPPVPSRGEPIDLPCLSIVDQPRYRHRGMLLDCCRHFMDKNFVKRYIDLLAYHKMNVLHWHLTEDQGWRIEIKKYPKLTEVGAWRETTRDSEQPRDASGRYGGFYSQDDVREIVAYAKSRFVTVIPEIEMPGHSLAALASYPELSCTGGPFKVRTEWGVEEDVYCAGNERVFEFLEDVLSEVIELFPSEFIHIGGDECPKNRWKACDKCQARIKAEGLKDEHELQSYFIRRIEKFLSAKGRRIIGWDEILEGGLAPNATVQSWRGMSGAIAAATSGHDVVSSPTTHCYLDYPQEPEPAAPSWMGFIDLPKIYSFEPTPAELTREQARHVLGAEGNIWTERAPQRLVDHQVFPRLCALAEVAWSPVDSRNWDDFVRRMRTHYRRLDQLGVGYCVPRPQLAGSVDTRFTESVELSFTPPFELGEIRYTLDGAVPTPDATLYAAPIRLTETTTVRAITFLPNARNHSKLTERRFVRLRPNEPVAVAGSKPGLRYAYYQGDWRDVPDLATLTPVREGVAEAIDDSLRQRDERYALRFTGYVEVAADGVYTFYVTAADTRLRIGATDPAEAEPIGDKGERCARVWLRPGLHPIQLDYGQKVDGHKLVVTYEGPGIGRRPVPTASLHHAGQTP